MTFCVNVFAQKSNYSGLVVDADWHEGSILLADETELIGLVSYNDKKGTISFENGSQSRTYVARNVIAFEFHDSRTDQQRLFYSPDHDDGRTGIPGPFIFEVLREFGHFSVLYKVDPLEFEQVDNWQNNGVSGVNGSTTTHRQTYVKVSQYETIYLFTEEKAIVPLIEMTFSQSQGRIIDRSKMKSKLLNKDVLKRCMGDLFPQVEAYAKENKLRFDDMDQFLIILDYYQDLLSE